MALIGQHLREPENRLPSNLRERAKVYWERRLAVAKQQTDRGEFQDELGTIGSWISMAVCESTWLMRQLTEALSIGIRPDNVFMVVSWLATVSLIDPPATIAAFRMIIDDPKTATYGIVGNDAEARTILSAGLASDDSKTRVRARAIIGKLATMNQRQYLDLLPGNGS